MSGLSQPRILFGVHSISPYSRLDRTPYGILKVIGKASIALNSSVEQLYGGAQRFPWAAETKTIGSEITCQVKAYPGFLFTLFLGATSTDNAAEALASVTALANQLGTSCFQATTGIASVQVKTGSEKDVKFGKYLVVAASATTVNVYCYSDIDFARNTAIVFQNDALKVNASALTIVASTAVTIPSCGITLTGGSGTIGMTTGDTCYFSARPENTLSSDITIGGSNASFPAFGAIMLAQKRSDGEMFEVEAFNVIGSGMPLGLEEMKFSMSELKMDCLYDSVADAVFKIRHVVPSF